METGRAVLPGSSNWQEAALVARQPGFDPLPRLHHFLSAGAKDLRCAPSVSPVGNNARGRPFCGQPRRHKPVPTFRSDEADTAVESDFSLDAHITPARACNRLNGHPFTMPAFRYNKAADQRDWGRAQDILKSTGFYSGHSDRHLANALRFAKGCSGCEAKARRKMIEEEMARRRH